MLIIEDLSVQYSERFKNNCSYVLNNLNLAIEKGEHVALIGPSGCGKSTLLRTIIGLVNAVSGKVFIDSQQLLVNNKQSIRHKIGYVFQDGGLFPHLTAKENVALPMLDQGITKDKAYSRIEELSELVMLDSNHLDLYPNSLSGGQKQRVALMRALALEPQLLLLDEPMGALDPLLRYQLQNDLKEIFNKLNMTLLLVTHDLSEAAFLCERLIFLNNGKLVYDDSRDNLAKSNVNEVKLFLEAQRPVIL